MKREVIVKFIFIIIFLFTLYSMINPWEHYLIDIIDIDGLRIEIDLKPQILFGIERDWRELCICLPYFNLYILWGNHIKKNGPR